MHCVMTVMNITWLRSKRKGNDGDSNSKTGRRSTETVLDGTVQQNRGRSDCNLRTAERKGVTMADDHTYNGWTNRATWLVQVHDFFDLDHVKHGIEMILDGEAGRDAELNKYIIAGGVSGMKRAVIVALAQWLEDDHSDWIWDANDPVFLSAYLQDHMQTSLGAIDWLDIAEHYEEEVGVAMYRHDLVQKYFRTESEVSK